MDVSLKIVPAGLADQELITRIIERSIRGGCARDHRNDQHQVRQWADRIIRQACLLLAEGIGQWRLAQWQGKPVGIAMATDHASIELCYVLPHCLRRGVGRGLMSALESHLFSHGASHAQLSSTQTARPFYQEMGYVGTGHSTPAPGFTLTYMEKCLCLAPTAAVEWLTPDSCVG